MKPIAPDLQYAHAELKTVKQLGSLSRSYKRTGYLGHPERPHAAR